jgi:hypothetical protein
MGDINGPVRLMDSMGNEGGEQIGSMKQFRDKLEAKGIMHSRNKRGKGYGGIRVKPVYADDR